MRPVVALAALVLAAGCGIEPELAAAPTTPATTTTATPTPATTTTTTATPTSTTTPPVTVLDRPATGSAPAVRLEPAATAPPPAAPIPGDCDSWTAEFTRRGATADEISFFFDGGIIWRETRCGADTLNESSGDTGICQINPIHNQAGYFGGVEFGDGGWLFHLHGLRTRQDHTSPVWADACITMMRVCGFGPWRPPYSCANRDLS